MKTKLNNLPGVTMASSLMERQSPTAMRALSILNPMTKVKLIQIASKLSALHSSDRLWEEQNGI